jgi:hypothetical protein
VGDLDGTAPDDDPVGKGGGLRRLLRSRDSETSEERNIGDGSSPLDEADQL